MNIQGVSFISISSILFIPIRRKKSVKNTPWNTQTYTWKRRGKSVWGIYSSEFLKTDIKRENALWTHSSLRTISIVRGGGIEVSYITEPINEVVMSYLDLHQLATLQFRGFPTRMVYLDYITCLRYSILVGNPRFVLDNFVEKCISQFFTFSCLCDLK